MITPSLHIHLTVDSIPEMLAAVKALEDRQVLVGIPESKTERKNTVSAANEGITNAEIAYIQDRGSPAQNIPQREFMMPGIQAVEEPVLHHMRGAATNALDGNASGMERSLTAVGLIAVSGIRNRIQTGEYKLLSRRTLAARRSRGHSSEKPLVEFGEMRNAITSITNRRRKKKG